MFVVGKVSWMRGNIFEILNFFEILKNLKISGKILMAFSNTEKDLRIASRNIKKVENILTSQLNVLEMLKSKFLLLTKESVNYLEEKYGK